MFGSAILDVAIGLVFIYILVSIVCSAVREGIEAFLKTRAAYLERGIRDLLIDRDGTQLASSVLNHPLIRGLFAADRYEAARREGLPLWMRRGHGKPSYIPSRNFAMALLDIAARGPIPNAANSNQNARLLSLENVRRNVANIQDPNVQRVVLAAVDSAQGNLDKAQAALEAWYDSAMDRVSGWYKRATHWILFAIGLLLAALLQIDTIGIVRELYEDKNTRDAVVAMAENTSTSISTEQAKAALSDVQLPIGWAGWERGFPDGGKWWPEFWRPLLGYVPGWLLTAFAATLGAPFWFDVLNKVMVIRSTVKPREKSAEEASEDRQLKPAAAGATTAPSTTVATTTTPPGVPPPIVGNAADLEMEVDGCDVDLTQDPTSDEQLPAAEGGVA